MDYAERLRQARRLQILQLLAQSPGYEAAVDLLYQALPSHGLAASVDVVRADVSWLEEQGLVSADELGSLRLVKIATRGLDVAAGVARVPGVARPLPED